jgi:hypothetical protein
MLRRFRIAFISINLCPEEINSAAFAKDTAWQNFLEIRGRGEKKRIAQPQPKLPDK